MSRQAILVVAVLSWVIAKKPNPKRGSYHRWGGFFKTKKF